MFRMASPYRISSRSCRLNSLFPSALLVDSCTGSRTSTTTLFAAPPRFLASLANFRGSLDLRSCKSANCSLVNGARFRGGISTVLGLRGLGGNVASQYTHIELSGWFPLEHDGQTAILFSSPLEIGAKTLSPKNPGSLAMHSSKLWHSRNARVLGLSESKLHGKEYTNSGRPPGPSNLSCSSLNPPAQSTAAASGNWPTLF
mmetsp:Transcript_31005/g.68094  ORF Transcript_31005/g.68094 Transcript_31005/m.68094 type:complete len:201 (-) Transcript_31005:673-1275(-)